MKSSILLYLMLALPSAALIVKDLKSPSVNELKMKLTGPQATSDRVPRDAFFLKQIINPDDPIRSVHSGTLTELSDGRIMAAWFGGTREGARDVRIWMSTLPPSAPAWSSPTPIASPEQTSVELERRITKLGNPILFTDSRGKLWLFYVSVSFGGWSGSSINVKYSDDHGVTWSEAKRLVTSPFLNISTLLKGTPIECESGHMLLPVYHEFLRKFGEMLILSPDGHLVGKKRLTATQGAIQPYLVPTSADASHVFYRQSAPSPKKVMMQSFSKLVSVETASLAETNIDNPNASVAAVLRDNGTFIMVCNPIIEGRDKLSIATSEDGENWRIVYDIETGETNDEFSYPYLIRSKSGDYHLIYTWKRTKMRYASFNETWLESLK